MTHVLRLSIVAIISIITSFRCSAQVNLNQGLVGCYSFSGDAQDGSGNNNNGTPNGAVLVSDRFGNANSAYLFDGNGAHISLPADGFKNTNYSYSVWVYPLSDPPFGETYRIISLGGSGGDQNIDISNNYFGWTGWDAGGYNTNGTVSAPSTGTLPAINQWYHAVVTRDNNTVRLYINAQLVGTANTGGLLPFYGSGTTYVNIGGRSTLIQFYHGIVDDVSIYNRAISADEVTALYANFSCPKINSPVVVGASRCGSGTVTLSASGGTQYHWYDHPTSGTIKGTGSTFVTPTLTATTTYYVTNVEGGFESDRKPVTATILDLPAPPSAADAARCGPGLITLQAIGSLQYRWYSDPADDTPISTSSNYTTELANTTSFYVSSFDGQCESASVEVVAIINPELQLNCALPSEIKVKSDTIFSSSITGGNGPFSFEWDFGNDHSLNNDESQIVYAYPKSGAYSVVVNVTDSNGCQAQCTQIVNVFTPVNIPPNVFTPNGDAYNETFTINFEGDENFEMVIYNRWGKLVAVIQDGIRGWDGSGCSSGVYFYQIKVANKEFKGWVSLVK